MAHLIGTSLGNSIETSLGSECLHTPKATENLLTLPTKAPVCSMPESSNKETNRRRSTDMSMYSVTEPFVKPVTRITEPIALTTEEMLSIVNIKTQRVFRK